MLKKYESVTIEGLIADHYQSVYRFAYRLCGSEHLAADLTQDTFIRALEKIEQIRDPARAKAWLFTILRNLYRRTMTKESRLNLASLEEEPHAIQHSESVVAEVDPESLQAALNQIDEEFRTPIILYFFDDISYRDIAEIMNIPIGTVMSRLARGKEYLKQLLEPKVGWDSSIGQKPRRKG